jgi:UDP-N-acetylmuramoyl-L-alanyl-D-glutamate--2,6-diaminopimelate ligase
LAAIDALGIKRLATDSRKVLPGDTFLAYPGEARDGRDYIPQALANGAGSVLWDDAGFTWNPSWRVPALGVPNLRRRAGEIASHVLGRPSAKLWVIGVTGTNGKTSCSQWIAQSLTRLGRKCGVIGTLGSGFPGRLKQTPNTTPDAVWLHTELDVLLRAGARAVSMEVSSIGLAQHRLAGIEFDVALLTNFSRDHLDYHGTMRRYRAAKARLFNWPTLQYAALNLDDRLGADLAARVQRPGLTVLGYGFARPRPLRIGGRQLQCVQGRNLRIGADGLSFDVSTPWGRASMRSRLIGRFNAANLLGSLTALLASNVGLEDCIRALERVKPVPGRTECYGGGRSPLVVVDYAHTPEALKSVLNALREIMDSPGRERAACAGRREGRARRRLICLFGCGGERDRGKRPQMAAVAAALADEVVVTSDNPRGEAPEAIIRDIVAGLGKKRAAIEPDRARAIRLAIGMARPGDVVLVAGKGHESYQEIGGVKHPFSDAAEVAAALRAGRG